MKLTGRWRFGLIAVAGAIAAGTFAALASVGSAVSPSSTPAAASQYPKKVLICHRTRSKKNPFRTIRISRNAVKAHLRHGDPPSSVGRGCNGATFVFCHKTKKGKKATIKVKGVKRAAPHARHGDKAGACKAKKGKRKGKGKNPKPPKQ